MPTGYTADLYEGKPQSFEEFALRCAHNFGALITLRDEGMDSEIPEFVVSDYYDERVAKAQERLARLGAYSHTDKAREAGAAYEAKVKACLDYEEQAIRRRTAYEAMLERVVAWSPPTPDHVGLREFMESQLRESIDFDCNLSYNTMPTLAAPDEWWEAEMARAVKDLAYARDELAKENERVNGCNAWVTALRESLATVEVSP